MPAARVLQPELMDQPGLDPTRHAQALRGLARINRVSRAAATLWPPVRAAVKHRAGSSGRVLDVACGGGDVAVGIARLARRDGVDLAIGGCDVSPTALHEARRRAETAGVDLATHRLDALRDPLPDGYDVAVCSLFLHHLQRDEAVALLRRLAQRVDALAISDLDRSRLGLLAAQLGTRLLSRSPIVHVDGPRSVRAAFRAEEAIEMAQEAGLIGAVVRRVWPFRWLLTWRRAS